MELKLTDFITKPDVNEKLRQGILRESDPVVKECVTDIWAYHYFYDQPIPPIPPIPPVPPTPVGPKDNEIWYTTTDGEIYDLGGIIEAIVSMGGAYNGPAVVSNAFDEEKQMWLMTFEGDVKVLGDADVETMIIEGPFFTTNLEYGITCNVKTIILPKSVTRIGSYAFAGCSSLTSVTIPDSVTSIGERAFYYCTGLTSVTIPNSITSIGRSAFYNCSSLTSVTIEAETPPTLSSDVFHNTNDCPIYVPVESVDAYKTAWSTYADRIVGLLNNNQIRYTANEQLTIQSGVDYSDHTFDSGVGIVTFSNNLTTLEESWFKNTFDNYAGNITSLTLPNGVSTIGMSALPSVNTVYYEGTQKECARIDKDWIDGTGVSEYHCFDGIVNNFYNSNTINPMLLWYAVWLRDLIGEEVLNYLMTIISSAKIDEHPMTASEFITMFVNGTQGNPGISTYGFTVVNHETEGVTIPLAYHTSGHFITIVKANDYAHVDLTHFTRVAVNESLDPDYMYILLDDTVIRPEPTTDVEVTIEHEDGSSETTTLDANQTYAGQGYGGYYSQNTYDSSIGEMPENFLVDNDYPADGVTIYDYCNDISDPSDEPAEE